MAIPTKIQVKKTKNRVTQTPPKLGTLEVFCEILSDLDLGIIFISAINDRERVLLEECGPFLRKSSAQSSHQKIRVFNARDFPI